MRSRVESFTILNSKTPVKFAQELINHYDNIFSESTLKLHAESEKRRLAKPIVAVQQQEEKANKRGSLMSFMRPTINTAEELNKWTVNSMMGVFQRNNTTAASPTNVEQQSPLARTVPLSFGSTITRQESPPSSPVVSPSASVPEAKKKEAPATVMFDGGDDIFDEKDDALHTSADDILQDIGPNTPEETANNTPQQPVRPAPEQVDSSFFDDDDDED